MPFSRITYTYTDQTSFAVNFTLGYIDQTHVTARVNDEVDGSNEPLYRTITWITSGTVSISGSLTSGDVIVFERTTPKDALQNDYQDDDILDEKNLDNSFKQALMVAHEALDGRLAVAADNRDMGNNRIVNLANAVDAQDAVTLSQVESLTGNAPASAAAAAVSAAAALVSEGNASTSADLAEDWAEEDEDVEVTSGKYSAKHHALKAAVSASNLPTNNFTATAAPTATDDSSSGYSVGSRWVDTTADESYICVDSTATSAVWLSSTLTLDELGALGVLNTLDGALIDDDSVPYSKMLNTGADRFRPTAAEITAGINTANATAVPDVISIMQQHFGQVPNIPKVVGKFTPNGASAPTLNYDVGITSVTRQATGVYRVTFDDDFDSTDYAYDVSFEENAGNDTNLGVCVDNINAGYIDVLTGNSSGVATDGTGSVSIQVWGTLA